MVFKDRLRAKRKEAHLTQAELAEKVGVTSRTIQNYELGARNPANMITVQRLAEVLHTTPEYLLGSSGSYVVDAQERGGRRAARDVEALVDEITGLFAGGELSDDSLDGAMKALTEAYWIAREKNKKYTPEKYRESAREEN